MSETSVRPPGDTVSWSGFRQGDSWVIAVSGELDLACDESMRDGFAQAADASCDRIVVDASGITFVDCGGVRVLLAAATGCGGEVWLRSPSQPVRRLAELAGWSDEWRAGTWDGDVRIA